MKTLHTPEPWYAVTQYDFAVTTAAGKEIGSFSTYEDSSRAVECVNALAGIENPAKALEAVRAAISAIYKPLGDETEERGNPCKAPNSAEGRALAKALQLITPKP